MLKKTIQQIILIVILTAVITAILWFKLPYLHNMDPHSIGLHNTGLYNISLRKLTILCLLLSSLIILFINRLLKYFEVIRYLHSPISTIDKMTGEEFEYYLKCRFEREKYKVELTKASQDYGADLILTNNSETIVVQAKRYDANVGTAAIQEVVAAKEYYQADSCMVVTNSHFTINALNLAEANEVELRDRDDLLERTLR